MSLECSTHIRKNNIISYLGNIRTVYPFNFRSLIPSARNRHHPSSIRRPPIHHYTPYTSSQTETHSTHLTSSQFTSSQFTSSHLKTPHQNQPTNQTKKPKMSYKISHDPSLSPSSANAKIQFLESFYATSDTESKHEEYVTNYFTPDATLIMGPKMANGTDGIYTLLLPPLSIYLSTWLYICIYERGRMLIYDK